MSKLFFAFVELSWYKGDDFECETEFFAFKSRKQRRNFLERQAEKFECSSKFVCVELGNSSPVKSGYMLIEYKNGKKVETFYPYTL